MIAIKKSMVIAFENFKKIDESETLQEKQKLWLEDYNGISFSKARGGTHFVKWTSEPQFYDKDKFTIEINCIGRKRNRLVIEFDEVEGEPDNPKEAFEKVKQKLKDMEVGFILSTHQSQKSDYLWVEFNRDLTTKEAKNFLMWICPEGAEIDLNFTSDKKVFPVLFAEHWKYPYKYELPIEFVEGNRIDYNSLDIIIQEVKEIVKLDKDGFAYKTYQAANVFSNKGRATEFAKAQPIFYDKAGLFWLWNPDKYFWECVDEVEILNMIEESTGQDIITPKNRTLILNSLKQAGRKIIPEPIKPTWVQFKDTLVDIKTSEQFKASPKYFVTNPIDWELENENFATPNMDKIFEEWVGEDNVELLYEIIAYSLLPDYPIHRIFCFIGSGLNGKSKFLELLRKFVGTNNVCSTELDTLLSSRFEVTRLHKKLVCQMGETNFNEMSKTSLLKKLSGGDLIGYEYKNKNPFEDKNYAKIIIATNNLPTTTDKTIGFYRRWTILDFPNQFDENKDILESIPEEEYNSLALRCVVTLKGILEKRKFTNEGTIEQRKEKYEAKSNFLEQFLSQFTIQDINGYITKADFYKKFVAWSKENKHREMAENSVGRDMKKIGIETERRYFDWLFDGKGGQLRCWTGIKWIE